MKAAHAVAAAISKATAKDGMSITLAKGSEKFFIWRNNIARYL